jgi:hypothetical protein
MGGHAVGAHNDLHSEQGARKLRVNGAIRQDMLVDGDS